MKQYLYNLIIEKTPSAYFKCHWFIFVFAIKFYIIFFIIYRLILCLVLNYSETMNSGRCSIKFNRRYSKKIVHCNLLLNWRHPKTKGHAYIT